MSVNKSIIIGIVLIAIIIAVAYFAGKKKGGEDFPEYTPPADPGNGDNASQYIDNNFVQTMVGKLYEDLKGMAFFETYSVDTWQGYASASDTNFVAIYNEWNDKYYSKWNKTLVQKIQNERSSLGPMIGVRKIKEAMDTILSKADRLNLM
jgi:hypothetical protein